MTSSNSTISDFIAMLKGLTIDQRKELFDLIYNPTLQVQVKDIQNFFKTSTKNKNDSVNKNREQILSVILTEQCDAFMLDPTHGSKWQMVRTQFSKYLSTLCSESYIRVSVVLCAGRCYNYDFKISFVLDSGVTIERNVEFKFGKKTICSQPQFLSLYTSHPLTIGQPYHEFYILNKCLEQYLRTDPGIIVEMCEFPTVEQYSALVFKTNAENYSMTSQMRNRKKYHTNEKNKIVNTSITDYLHQTTVNIPYFIQLLRESQTDKHYALWCDGEFYYDRMREEEMTDIVFSRIVNGNVIVCKNAYCEFWLLLRWKNDKGILGPAWQISIKNRKSPELMQESICLK